MTHSPDHYATQIIGFTEWWIHHQENLAGYRDWDWPQDALPTDVIGGHAIGQPSLAASDVISWDATGLADLIEASEKQVIKDRVLAQRKAERKFERLMANDAKKKRRASPRWAVLAPGLRVAVRR